MKSVSKCSTVSGVVVNSFIKNIIHYSRRTELRTTPNMSQHIATRWPNALNVLRPTMLRYVALACCDRLAGALNDYLRYM